MNSSYSINDQFLVESAFVLNSVGLSNLEQAFNLVQSNLYDFANSSDFQVKFDCIFGKKNNTNLQNDWQNNDFSIVSTIEIVSSSTLNEAIGAFSIQKNRIYLSESLVNSSNLELISAVILEEIGHKIDSVVNEVDSEGDEGAIRGERV